MSAAANDDNNAGPTPAPREVRTVLLLGRTGQGKSSVANCLAGVKNLKDAAEVKFKIGHFAASQTKDHQDVTVTGIDGAPFDVRIIDSVGLGDTTLKEQEVYFMLARAIACAKDGIHQIFFCLKDKFTKEEVQAFNVLGMTVLDNNAMNFTTVVRTGCFFFEDTAMCAQDLEVTKGQNDETRTILEGCKATTWVNLPVTDPEGDVTKSRLRLLTRLAVCDKAYIPPALKDMQAKITKLVNEADERIKEQERKQAELEKLRADKEASQAAIHKLELEAEKAKTAAVQAKLDTAETMRKIAEDREREIAARPPPPPVFISDPPPKSKCSLM